MADHLEWLTPLVLMAGLGAVATIAARVAAAGAGIVAVAWVLSNIVSGIWLSVPWLRPLWVALPFDATDPATWYWNRLSIGLIGAGCLAVTGLLLGRSEHLMGAER
ncbi:MAG: hypothetical protein M3Z65_06270 [Chloroflexota bacterium]|nr:hypothetical protein [Chloroflexota bacterium]